MQQFQGGSHIRGRRSQDLWAPPLWVFLTPSLIICCCQGSTVILGDDGEVVDTWGEDLVNPHDVAVSHAGDAVYVVEIGPNAVRKFEIVKLEA